MISRLMGQSAFIVRTAEVGRDRLNRPVIEEVSRVQTRCRLEQTGSAEGDTYVVDQWRGFFPLNADIRPDDTIEESGRRFTVQGTPSREIVPGVPGANHLGVVLRYVGEIS